MRRTPIHCTTTVVVIKGWIGTVLHKRVSLTFRRLKEKYLFTHIPLSKSLGTKTFNLFFLVVRGWGMGARHVFTGNKNQIFTHENSVIFLQTHVAKSYNILCNLAKYLRKHRLMIDYCLTSSEQYFS